GPTHLRQGAPRKASGQGRVQVGAPGREVERDPGWTFCLAAPLIDDLSEIVEWVGMASDLMARRQGGGERASAAIHERPRRGKVLSAINGRLMPMTLGLAYRPMACLLPRSCSRFGPTTPKHLGAVTVHQPMVTSIQTCVEPRGHLTDASVDPTE